MNYIGVVINNEDPLRLGRVKIRIMDLYDDIQDENLPWALPLISINGDAFSIPDIKKVLNVIMIDNNIYNPYYTYCEHYNDDLTNQLKNTNDYQIMKAIIYDHLTKVYRTNNSLTLSHNNSNLSINNNSSIELNLMNNNKKITLGSNDAKENFILGDEFINDLIIIVDKLLVGYSGNLSYPLVPSPSLIQAILKFKASILNFKSKHFKISKNNNIKKVENTNYTDMQGDNINIYTKNENYNKLENIKNDTVITKSDKSITISENDLSNLSLLDIEDVIENNIIIENSEIDIKYYDTTLSNYNIIPPNNSIPEINPNNTIIYNILLLGLSQIGVYSIDKISLQKSKQFEEYSKMTLNKNTEKWSAIFISWLLNTIGYSNDTLKLGTVSSIIKEALKNNIKTPKIGDIFVLYDNNHSHCGLVIAINNDEIITIEGDYNNQVSSVVRKIKNIKGYYRWI